MSSAVAAASSAGLQLSSLPAMATPAARHALLCVQPAVQSLQQTMPCCDLPPAELHSGQVWRAQMLWLRRMFQHASNLADYSVVYEVTTDQATAGCSGCQLLLMRTPCCNRVCPVAAARYDWTGCHKNSDKISSWPEAANGDADVAVADCTPVDTSCCVQMGLMSTSCVQAKMHTAVKRKSIGNRD